MIFPIGDDQVKRGYFPFFSYALIALNVAIYGYQYSLGPVTGQTFVTEFGSIPNDIMHGKHFFTLLSSMFLHGSPMHLIGNMMFLWIFADNIEATIGNVKFILFYLLGGLAASAAHIWSDTSSIIPTIGASGAISAILGAYVVLFPKSQIKVFFFFMIFRVPAVLFLGYWFYQQLASGTSSLNEAHAAGVAWWAHIGGFVFGALVGLAIRLGGERGGRNVHMV